MTLLAAMVGAIALMSDVMRQVLRFGGRGRGGRGKGNPLALVVLVLWLLSLLVAPIVAGGVSVGGSRKREDPADATRAQLPRNPMALAEALEKIDAAPDATKSIARGAAHLCITDPGERRVADHRGL